MANNVKPGSIRVNNLEIVRTSPAIVGLFIVMPQHKHLIAVPVVGELGDDASSAAAAVLVPVLDLPVRPALDLVADVDLADAPHHLQTRRCVVTATSVTPMYPTITIIYFLFKYFIEVW
jgi:hypothetical protein